MNEEAKKEENTEEKEKEKREKIEEKREKEKERKCKGGRLKGKEEEERMITIILMVEAIKFGLFHSISLPFFLSPSFILIPFPPSKKRK